MKSGFRVFLLFIFMATSVLCQAQTNPLEITAAQEKKFSPYMATRHGGTEGLAIFKENNRYQYLKELWYFSESFYIKRNQLTEGATLDEAMIDITRFEINRKEYDEVIVPLQGFKDQLILLPAGKLIYKPDYK